MKTKYINPLLFSIVNNSLLFSKKNYQVKLKKTYFKLLNFLKKNNFIFFFKKKSKTILLYFKFHQSLSIIKFIKIYKNFKKNKILNINNIFNLKKNNNFFFYIFYNNLGFLTIEEVLKYNKGAYLIAKIF